MSTRRGDVVIVDWPLSRLAGSNLGKPRPAVVVQNNKDNGRLTNTILAMVNCVNLLTVEQRKILVTIGSLSGAMMQKVNNCLKAALELP